MASYKAFSSLLSNFFNTSFTLHILNKNILILSINIEPITNNIENPNTYTKILITDLWAIPTNKSFITNSQIKKLVFIKYTANADGAINFIIFVPILLNFNLENMTTWNIDDINIVGEIYDINWYLVIDKLFIILNLTPYNQYKYVTIYDNIIPIIILYVLTFLNISHFFIIEPRTYKRTIQIYEYPSFKLNNPFETVPRIENKNIIATKIIFRVLFSQCLNRKN